MELILLVCAGLAMVAAGQGSFAAGCMGPSDTSMLQIGLKDVCRQANLAAAEDGDVPPTMDVVVSRGSEDVSWILEEEAELKKRGIRLLICGHGPSKSDERNDNCSWTKNEGREPIAYALYVLHHHYSSEPAIRNQTADFTVFFDPHKRPWHWNHRLSKLDYVKCLQRSRWIQQKDHQFLGLNAHPVQSTDFGKIPIRQREWNAWVRSVLPRAIPPKILTDGSLHFLASRQLLNSLPRQFWQNIVDYCSSTEGGPIECGYFYEWVLEGIVNKYDFLNASILVEIAP